MRSGQLDEQPVHTFLANVTGDADVEGATERLHHHDDLAIKAQRKRRGYVKSRREDLYGDRTLGSKR